jgi:ribosomal protein S18 acetylase RimI-like enzyme
MTGLPQRDAPAQSPTLRAETNLCAAIKVWASAAIGGEIVETPGLLAMRVDAPVRAFNQAILRDLATVRTDLAVAVDWLRGSPRVRLRLRDELARGLDGHFAAAGLTPHGGIPSLALTRLTEVEPREIEGVEIRPVDDTNLTHHVAVVEEAFDWESDTLATVFTPRLLLDPAWRAYVAYVKGEPAATTQLVVDGAVAGLYYVGTRAAYRVKGLGEAVTRHAVRSGAALGCDVATLQASPAGYPVYQRIGFKDVAYYHTFVPMD